MNRRDFVATAGIFGGLSILPIPQFTEWDKPSYKMGYQLFSVRDAMAEDPVATLKGLKGMGYEDFEIYGYDDIKDTYYGFASREFREVLDDLGLTVTSGHYGFSPYLEQSENDLREFVGRCINGAQNLNSKYITWPWIAPEQRTADKYKLLARKLNLIGEQVNESGLGFAYHNHGYEFESLGDQSGFDILLKETDPDLVRLQMDMYWVMHSSNYSPEELIKAQPGRYVMWHIKDMDKQTRDYTELGNGSIDYSALLPDPALSGLEFYYLEQGGNFSVNSMQSAADSASYFKTHLKDLL